MAGLVHGAAQWFWDPDIWLPPNVTWESFDTTQVVKQGGDVIQPGQFARFGDLWYPIPLAVVVMAVRQVVEKLIFKPLGVKLGLKDKARQGPVEKPILEKAFNTYNGRGTIDSSILARDTGMTVIQVIISEVICFLHIPSIPTIPLNCLFLQMKISPIAKSVAKIFCQ